MSALADPLEGGKEKLSYQIIRYYHDLPRGEFINIGLVVFEDTPRGRFRLEFTRDWTLLRIFDRDFDVNLLRGLEDFINLEFVGERAREVVRTLSESLVSPVVVGEARHILVESLDDGFSKLKARYVDHKPDAKWRRFVDVLAIYDSVR